MKFFCELYALVKFSIFVFTRLPKKGPIHVVVDKPIAVSKIDEPTQDQINHVHEIYVN